MLKKGLYRFEVDVAGQVQVFVFRGKLRWIQDRTRIADLKSGKVFDLNRSAKGQLHFSKVGKDPFDEIDRWSRNRAVALISANAKIPSWMSRSALSRYGRRSAGGWVYDPFSQMHTFIPFHFLLKSPYGLAYGNYCPTWRSYASGGYRRSSLSMTGTNPGWSASTTSAHRSSASTTTSSTVSAGSGAQQSRAAASSSIRGR